MKKNNFSFLAFLSFAFVVLFFLSPLCGCLTGNDRYQKNNKLVVFEDADFYYFSQGFPSIDRDLEETYRTWVKEMSEFFLRRADFTLYGSERAFASNYLQDILSIAVNRRLASILEEKNLFLKEISPVYHNKKLREVYFFGGLEKSFYKKLLFQLTPDKQLKSLNLSNRWNRLMMNWDVANFAAMDNIEKNTQKVSGYLQKVRSDLDLIQQTFVSAPDTVTLFESSTSAFVSLLQYDQEPLSGVPILISWKDENLASKTGWKSRVVESNEKGIVRFVFPGFFNRENSRIKFEIRRSSFRISSQIKDPVLLESFNKVLLMLDKKNLFFNPAVVSNAKGKKIAVMLLQVDRGGSVTSDTRATEVLVSEMEKESFAFFSFPPEGWAQMSSVKPEMMFPEIFGKIKPLIPESSQWVLVGNILLTSFDQRENLFEGMASGPIYLFDKNGQLFYETIVNASGRGNNAETVLAIIWRTLGRNIRRDLLKILP